ncbi:MAG: tetratricopeptide repeat protein [Planctomycetota bacterium]|nr:tetratricopeptide repeat protein [Planctomycetota bacterium]
MAFAATTWALALAAWSGGHHARVCAGEEVTFPDEAYKKLETFEEHSLRKADKFFEAKNYKQGAAAFEAFITEFANSKAVPYALVQKGRCLELDNKRNAALKTYTEILDYFPNDGRYAAAALYFSGLCHWENGDREKAMTFWARMAQDENFSRHFLAAGALNRLADHYLSKDDAPRAAQTYRQVAVNFRKSNERQAKEALDKAVELYVRKPDEEALRALYVEAQGFGARPAKVESDAAQDRSYWDQLRAAIRRHGAFEAAQAELHDRYYRYWAGAFEGKFPNWDEFQIDRIDFAREHDRDTAKWIERLDAQFKSDAQDDGARIVKWIALFIGQDAKVEEYYQKLDFAKLKNESIFELMRAFFDAKGQEARGRNVFEKLRLEELGDDYKTNPLSAYLWSKKQDDLMERLCATFRNRPKGQARLLEYYYHQRNAQKGVKLADELAPEAEYAGFALFRKGELLRFAGKHAEAIAAYRQSDSPPQSLFHIAECLVAQKQVPQAVAQLREVENFFKDHASEALWRIAHVYKDAGEQKPYVASLRELMNKYPKSGQSAYAHDLLEKMNVKIGGGVNANP